MSDDANKIEPTQQQPPKVSETNLKYLEIGFLALAVFLGFAHVWADHHYLKNADIMSYLDVAEAYLRKDWHTAVNAYWGPLYSWLIALTLFLTKPSPYWKFTVVHLLNLVIFLFAFGCFGFMMRGLLGRLRSQRAELLKAGLVILPDWAVLTIGFSLLLWSSLLLVTIPLESPDMLVASFVYLATGIILRIRKENPGWLWFVLLGVTLGFGYLSKAVMLPMSGVFVVTAAFAAGNLRRAIPRIAVTVALFAIVAGPFIVALSKSKGRFTTGETGKLNYLWSINQVPNNNWQGEPPSQLKHPTRQIHDNPATFEFGEPVSGTYPVWYDPTYWYEGSVSHFDLRGQLRVFINCLRSYYDVFQSWGVQYGLLVGLLCLYLMGGRPPDISRHWRLLLPAIAGLGLYSLVAVEKRFVASFLTLLWLGLFSSVRLRHSTDSLRLIRMVSLVLVASIVLTSLASSMNETSSTASQLVRGEDRSLHEQWQVAEGLREVGMVPSDKVAFIGDSFRAFWAHLLGVRIVAEVRRNEVENFWKADSIVKGEVINAFARTGVKAVVAERPPYGNDLSNWQRIRDTEYYVYILRH